MIPESPSAMRLQRVDPSTEGALARLFARIAADEAARDFHPHAFTSEMAHALTHGSTQDEYLLGFVGDEAAAYGLLRGWDAGFATPSLGIYVVPEARGTGAATWMMGALHDLARRRGAERVRLKVYVRNAKALALYQRLGYVFEPPEGGEQVGLLHLTSVTGTQV